MAGLVQLQPVLKVDGVIQVLFHASTQKFILPM